MKKDTHSRLLLLVLGLALPFQLHYGVLIAWSIWHGHAHHFLGLCKLAESVVEGTISATVQTYAVIYRDLHPDQLLTAYFSILLSLCSIGFAFACFDRKEVGMNKLPGLAKLASPQFATVFVFRVCEITSRVTSVALFSLSVRNEWCYEPPRPSPFCQDCRRGSV